MAQSHLDLAVDDYVRRGMPETEARRLALKKFGPVEAAKDAHRDSCGMAWFDGLLYDLRLTLRGLRRDRTFTLAAIAMLALAIALNVTVFTVMDTILFRGYPLVKRNDRLVYLQEHGPSGACCISYLDFQDWRAQAHSFEGIGDRIGEGHHVPRWRWTPARHAHDDGERQHVRAAGSSADVGARLCAGG